MGQYADRLLGQSEMGVQGSTRYSDRLLGRTQDQPVTADQPQQESGMVPDRDPGHLKGVGRQLLQGATFGWSDELGAAAAALITNPILRALGLPEEKGSFSDLYRENLGQFAEEKQAYAQQHPVASAAAEIAGGVTTGLAGGGRVLAGKAYQGGSAVQKLGMLSGVGAAEGAVYGAGTAAPDARAEGAAQGALIGGVTAPVIGGILKAGGAAGKWALAKIGQTPRDQAIKAIRKAAEAEGISADDAVRLLDDLGPEATLADLGENFRALARVATNKQGPARAVARRMLDARQVGQQGRLLSAAQQAAGANADDFRSTVNLLTARRSVTAKPLYDDAFSTPIQPTEAMEKILQRPSIKAAMTQARRIAADEGDDVGESLVKQIHYAKVALDRKIEALFSAGKRQEGRALVKLKNDLLTELDAAVPSYAEARRIYAGDSALLSAADKGKNLFRADVEELTSVVDGMSASEKELFKLGALRAIQDKMDTIPQTHDSVKRLLGQPKMQKLLGLVFDDEASLQAFIRRAAAENEMARTRNVITGNSTTAAQLEGAAELAENIQPGTISAILRGDFAGAGLDMLSKVIGKQKVSPQMLDELTNALLQQGMSPDQVRAIIGSPTATEQLIRLSNAPYAIATPGVMALTNQSPQR